MSEEKKDPELEKLKEELKEELENPPRADKPMDVPKKGNLWILIQFDPEKGYNWSTTNVKEGTTWLGMLELSKGSFLENHFKRTREVPQLIVPKKLVLPS